MSWNYRVTRKVDPDGTPVYSIREVYYDAVGNVNGWSENASWAQGESQDELAADCANHGRAFLLPVIDIDRAGCASVPLSGASALTPERSAEQTSSLAPVDPHDEEQA